MLLSQKDREKKLIELYHKKQSADDCWNKLMQEYSSPLDREAFSCYMQMCDEADKAILDFIFQREAK